MTDTPVISWAATNAKWEREAKLRQAKVAADKSALLAALASRDIAIVTITYDGSGDDEQIDRIEAFKADNTTVTLTADIPIATPSINSSTGHRVVAWDHNACSHAVPFMTTRMPKARRLSPSPLLVIFAQSRSCPNDASRPRAPQGSVSCGMLPGPGSDRHEPAPPRIPRRECQSQPPSP
jgi:hypothetical protein